VNYFVNSPDWNDIILDRDLYKEIYAHHKALSSVLSFEGIDGFYFIDQAGYAILVDSNSLQVMAYKVGSNEEIR
jgi:hypothetical protein